VLENETGLAEETAQAMRELASTVTDAPPLRLAPGRAPQAPRPGGKRRWSLWAVPLTAAVAVIALAVALVTIRDLPNGPVAPPPSPTSAPTSVAGVPAYYAEPELLCPTCVSALVVANTFSGAKLATFRPPHGTTFVAVSAAADDRTFVADTVDYPLGPDFEAGHVTWYLLKITPGASTPVRLTRMTIPDIPPAASIGTAVLSPSGGELAVTYQLRNPAPGTDVVGIYSVATGKLLNSWSTAVTGDSALLAPFGFASMQSNNLLSWIDGGRALSFTTITNSGSTHVLVAVRTLELTTGGGNLITDSRVVWSMRSALSEASACAWAPVTVPWVTANGKTIVCFHAVTNDPGNTIPSDFGEKKPRTWWLTWLAYPTSDPKAAEAARTLYKFTTVSTGAQAEGFNSVQWADATGSTMIVAWTIETTTSSALHFGVVSHGRYTPLPTPPGISLVIPPDIAW
jgi:hypothetical protein